MKTFGNIAIGDEIFIATALGELMSFDIFDLNILDNNMTLQCRPNRWLCTRNRTIEDPYEKYVFTIPLEDVRMNSNVSLRGICASNIQMGKYIAATKRCNYNKTYRRNKIETIIKKMKKPKYNNNVSSINI